MANIAALHSEAWDHSADRAVEHAALQLFQRYLREFIEAFGICPYAERTRLTERIRYSVFLQPLETIATTSIDIPIPEIVDSLVTTSADLRFDMGFAILPRCTLKAADFDAFVARVRASYVQRCQHTGVVMALATFHPQAPFDASTPHRLIPFLRRSPDPTIQMIRIAALEHVRRGDDTSTHYVSPDAAQWYELFVDLRDDRSAKLSHDAKQRLPLNERIHAANFQTLQTETAARLMHVLDTLRCDRDNIYADIAARSAAIELLR